MKKIIAVLIGGGLLLTATGCSSQLTTSETCDQVKAAISSSPGSVSDMTKGDRLKFYYKFKPVADNASDELKPALHDLTVYLAETVKDNPDTGKLQAMSTKLDAADKKLTGTCGN